MFLNGRAPPYMDSEDKGFTLTPDHIQHAVNSMTYGALQAAAACYMLLMTKSGFAPQEICRAIQELPDTTGGNNDSRRT